MLAGKWISKSKGDINVRVSLKVLSSETDTAEMVFIRCSLCVACIICLPMLQVVKGGGGRDQFGYFKIVRIVESIKTRDCVLQLTNVQ